MKRLVFAGWMMSMAALSVAAVRHGTQQIEFGEQAAQAKRGHVMSLTDGVQVTAGKAEDVELRFRVDEGFHINSHAPKDELLLPTGLKLEPVGTVKVLGEEYPKGTAFRLPSVGETLDVYQGEFRVRVRLLAERGSSTLAGVLRYQACDNAACFPPRSLPVRVLVTAK